MLQIMNMKPPEILSLLEEASGTKLYERKKDSAMKTLAKKQTKLEEIDEVSDGASWAALTGSVPNRLQTHILGNSSNIRAHALPIARVAHNSVSKWNWTAGEAQVLSFDAFPPKTPWCHEHRLSATSCF